jgi:hypothetical protein
VLVDDVLPVYDVSAARVPANGLLDVTREIAETAGSPGSGRP